MALINRSDLVERLRRAFGLTEPGVGATVSPEIVPVVLLEDLTGPSIDEGYPRLIVAKASAGASIGVFGEVFLINPIGSRTDFITQEIWLRPSATINTFRRGVIADLNNLLDTQFERFNLDLRVQRRPGIQVNSRNQAATIGTVDFTASFIANSLNILPIQYTIPPGHWISVHPGSNNAAEECFWFGYERLRTTS